MNRTRRTHVALYFKSSAHSLNVNDDADDDDDTSMSGNDTCVCLLNDIFAFKFQVQIMYSVVCRAFVCIGWSSENGYRICMCVWVGVCVREKETFVNSCWGCLYINVSNKWVCRTLTSLNKMCVIVCKCFIVRHEAQAETSTERYTRKCKCLAKAFKANRLCVERIDFNHFMCNLVSTFASASTYVHICKGRNTLVNGIVCGWWNYRFYVNVRASSLYITKTYRWRHDANAYSKH